MALVSDAPQKLAQQFSEELFCGLVDAAYGTPASVSEQLSNAMEDFGATKDNCFYVSGNPDCIKSAKSVGLYVMVLLGMPKIGIF